MCTDRLLYFLGHAEALLVHGPVVARVPARQREESGGPEWSRGPSLSPDLSQPAVSRTMISHQPILSFNS